MYRYLDVQHCFGATVPEPNSASWIENPRSPKSHRSAYHIISTAVDEDQQQHMNIPYLGDEVIEKEANFIASLAEEVSSSLATEGAGQLEDEIFLQLVDILALGEDKDPFPHPLIAAILSKATAFRRTRSNSTQFIFTHNNE